MTLSKKDKKERSIEKKMRARRKRALKNDYKRRRRIADEYGENVACARKRRYRTEQHAKSVAVLCELDRGVPLRVYKCPYCGGYHLTHLEEYKPKEGN